MTLEECRQLYIKKRGRDDLAPALFFADTPQEATLFVPFWDFEAQNDEQDGLFVAIARSEWGDELAVQDDVFEHMPARLEESTIAASLQWAKENIGSFLFCFVAGRLLLQEETYEYASAAGGFMLKRDNLTLLWQEEESLLTLIEGEDKKEYPLNGQPESFYPQVAAALVVFCSPVRTTISQGELLEALLERYPDFMVERFIHLGKVNTCLMQVRHPLYEGAKHQLWVFFGAEEAAVGIYPYVFADDMGLGVEAVCQTIQQLLSGDTLLLLSGKSDAEPPQQYKAEWLPKGNRTPEEVVTLLEARTKGFLNRARFAQSISADPAFTKSYSRP